MKTLHLEIGFKKISLVRYVVVVVVVVEVVVVIVAVVWLLQKVLPPESNLVFIMEMQTQALLCHIVLWMGRIIRVKWSCMYD